MPIPSPGVTLSSQYGVSDDLRREFLSYAEFGDSFSAVSKACGCVVSACIVLCKILEAVSL